MTQKEIDDRKKSGYRKASEVLGDPEKKDLIPLGHKFKKVKRKVSEESLDEAGLAPTTLAKAYKKGIKTGHSGAKFIQSFRRGYRKASNPPATSSTLAPSDTNSQTQTDKGEGVGKVVRMAGKGVKKAWGLWGDVMSSAARGALEEEKARKIRPLISIKKPIRIIKKDK
jgi:hypothetical protein